MRIDIHIENQEQLLKRLESTEKRVEPIIKKALNETVKKARKKIYSRVRSEYTIKSESFSQKDLKIKKATVSRLCALIQISGEPLSLKKAYKTSPNRKRAAAKAAVKKGALRSLQKGKLKGYMAQMQTKHKGVFQRTSKNRFPIKELMGPSSSKLSEKSYQTLTEEITMDLKETLAKMIDEIFTT